MWRFGYAVLLVLSFGLVLALGDRSSFARPAYAEDCVNYESLYDPGKTPEGFEATLTVGCHRVHWTSNTTDTRPVSGTVTFKTIGNAYPWDASGLPGPDGGGANRCRSYAAGDANRYATNLLKLPVGTEVTVTYRCW